MKLFDQFKGQVRKVANVYVRDYTPLGEDGLPDMSKSMKFPPVYSVKVQMKICGFWTTIWGKGCDISDGDTRTIIDNEADQVFNTLQL